MIPYVHVKTGKRYSLVTFAEDCTNARAGNWLAIYCPENDHSAIFARDLAEFEEKFKYAGAEGCAPSR